MLPSPVPAATHSSGTCMDASAKTNEDMSSGVNRWYNSQGRAPNG